MATTLKRFREDGRPAEDQGVLEASMQDCLARFQHHLDAVIRNFPNPIIRLAMRVGALPLGITYKPASDKQNYRLAKAILQPGAWQSDD